jgi:uracil-DNA glycosylase family 4
MRRTLGQVQADVVACTACPRLVKWRRRVACEKRAAYFQETYWGRPVPGFGDRQARILACGLAPAAHGANRTGRVFTGDRSGTFLWAALHRAGLASRPESVHRDDGLRLADCYITAVVRCCPPGNLPTPDERDRCLPYLVDELRLLRRVRCIVCLGGIAWDGILRALAALGEGARPRPRFGHQAEVVLGRWTLLGCYHPSQQNTFTGRLTARMLDAVLAHAVQVATSTTPTAGGPRVALPG